jgi:hypothetical protein
MAGIGSILQSIGGSGGALGDILGGAKLGLSGFGVVDQIMQARQRQDMLNRALAYQKDPKRLASLVSGYTKPLDTGLVKGVGNEVQGYLAERGLSQSPSIQSEVLSQSLAPYMQQNQQRALQMALQVMGIPLEALATIGPGGGTSGLAGLLATLGKINPGGANPTAGSPMSAGGDIFAQLPDLASIFSGGGDSTLGMGIPGGGGGT